MVKDDDLLPRLGRQRSQDASARPRYLGQVLAATNRARSGAGQREGKGFSGGRIGRGGGIGRMLASRGDRMASSRRRVIVKASIVRLAGKGAGAAAAHLRYLRRDGTTREGERGHLYGRDEEVMDARTFHERGAGDRHQFRFIVSPEDGDQYEDLKPLTRRLMMRMEEDLGTKLDWVAVDHFNTGHPHSHIVLRGKDERGEDLVIARDYLTVGIRERVAELVDLDLGPRTAREIEVGLRAEIEAERLTSIDRMLLKDAGPEREVLARAGEAFEQSLRAGRLAKLARLGLAQDAGAGRHRLAPDMEDTLRRMGERGDIIRTMQRAFTRAGVERSGTDQLIYDPAAPDAPALVGRVLAHGLADEHADRHYLIVDGIDGRSHYVAIGSGHHHAESGAGLASGAIVRVEPVRGGVRQADRTIAEVAAAHGGRYDVEAHLRHDPGASQTFAETHVRRLEAMRRGGGGVTREASGQWRIAPDHLTRVEAWQARQIADRPVTLTSLTTQPLGALVEVEAASWIDRDLARDAPMVRDTGFGHELREAMEQRRRWLLAEGFAQEAGGAVIVSKATLQLLQRRELLRVADGMAEEVGKPFQEAAAGSRVSGVFRRPVEMMSGRFALIERAHDFTLVPWAKVLERQAGQTVSGLMREGGINWSIGRGRSGPSIS